MIFDLTRRLPYRFGLAQRPLVLKLNPVFKGDFAATPGWELRGRVRSRVTLETTRIAFGDQCSHDGPAVSRKVRATAHVPLDRLEASAEPDLACVEVQAVADSPDNYGIIVSPHANLPVGPFTFEVRLRAITPDGEVYPCASILASGEMQPSFRVLPRLILLGEHSVPDQAETDIAVELPADGWSVDHLETDSSDTNVVKTGVDPEGRVNLRLSQRITAAGDQVAHVRIIVRKPDKQTEVSEVEVRYYGQVSQTPVSANPGVVGKNAPPAPPGRP